MIYDFSFVLVVLTAVFGLVLLWWRFSGGKASHAAEVAATPAGTTPKPEPWPVEYASAFFPVVVGVLILRAFLFEPFRIPSDSMMPTLLDGDFILVNKYTYGLRLPVVNKEFVKIGEPERGDVIVFRHPADHSVTYIKRLVGLPGDHIQVRGDAIWVNGQAMNIRTTGEYTEDECYLGFRQAEETLGKHTHRLMYCPVYVRRPASAAIRVNTPSVRFTRMASTPGCSAPSGRKWTTTRWCLPGCCSSWATTVTTAKTAAVRSASCRVKTWWAAQSVSGSC